MSESGEKTFAPSAKRLKDAARKGDVFRARELATAATMLIGSAWLMWAGPWVLGELSAVARGGFTFMRADIATFDPTRLLGSALVVLLPLTFSLALPVLIGSLVTQLGAGDGRWVGENIAFKGSRIDPLAGLKRMFGPNGLIEMAKGLAKVGLLGAVAWVWARDWLPTLAGLGRGNLSAQLSAAWDAIVSLMFALSAVLVLIGVVDGGVQWMRRNRRLRMSLQEIRDETKESEGSPETRSARRQRQRDIARGSVAAAMREAQFVVTNPVHFAVALCYDPDKAHAPIVLAKGRGDKALAMRELAAEFGKPVLESPQLARALYFTTREQQTIREELYVAVASVVAFVLAITRGDRPVLPEITVPMALRFDPDGRLEG